MAGVSDVACYHPLAAYKLRTGGVTFKSPSTHDGDSLSLPCGNCIGCRLERSRQWSLRCVHEASLHEHNAFITLTYNDENLPANGSLHYPDFQLFMKRLRKHYSITRGHPEYLDYLKDPKKYAIRFYMCGEYGDSTRRPHYHLCLFNCHISDKILHTYSNSLPLFTSPTLSKLWPFGHSLIGDLTRQSAAYTARYVMKKVNGQLAESHYQNSDGTHRVPEFNRMSLRPGIASAWYDKYHDDIHPHDKLIYQGTKYTVPKYYDRRHKRSDPLALAEAKAGREAAATAAAPDNTPERLLTREAVQAERLTRLKRTL
ncbi:MAG: replication initiator protein [Microvirus sp.]|nr:MAG: replication initiator protein [Microvirus sp.]